MLVAILGMLGSIHDGERAAAGLKVTELLTRLHLTWDNLIVANENTRFIGENAYGHTITPMHYPSFD